MKKILLLLSLVSTLFAATPEEVDRYLLVSGSEDQLIQMEQMMEGLGQMVAAKTGSDAKLMGDTQMFSIRFKEYLQRNLSSSEIQEIMENYNNDVMKKLVSAQAVMEEPDTIREFMLFRQQIKTDPLPSNRTEVVKTIIKNVYDEETLTKFFKDTYAPMLKEMSRVTNKAPSDKEMKNIVKEFIKSFNDANYYGMLYMTKDFSQDELEKLEDISKNSATSHETRAVFGAVSYSMSEAMTNLAKDMAKFANSHQAATNNVKAPESRRGKVTNTKPTKEKNTTLTK